MLRMRKQSNAIDAREGGRARSFQGNWNVRRLLHHCNRALRALAIVSALWMGACSTLQAQTVPAGTAHSVTLNWIAPSPVGGSGIIAGYNVYKSVAGAAFVKINTALISGLTATDASVSAGQSLSYCASTVDSKAQESACSVAVAATVPQNPNPPTLSITNVAIVNQNGQDRLQVDWKDANGASTAFTIFGAQGQVLKQGSQTAGNGVYSYAILIPVQSGVFTVCDAAACVSQSFVGI